jgi:MFS family permease
MKRREVSMGSVLAIYALGLAAGIQVALYLFDRFDDGVADARSGIIGIGLVLLGLGAIAVLFRVRA